MAAPAQVDSQELILEGEPPSLAKLKKKRPHVASLFELTMLARDQHYPFRLSGLCSDIPMPWPKFGGGAAALDVVRAQLNTPTFSALGRSDNDLAVIAAEICLTVSLQPLLHYHALISAKICTKLMD